MRVHSGKCLLFGCPPLNKRWWVNGRAFEQDILLDQIYSDSLTPPCCTGWGLTPNQGYFYAHCNSMFCLFMVCFLLTRRHMYAGLIKRWWSVIFSQELLSQSHSYSCEICWPRFKHTPSFSPYDDSCYYSYCLLYLDAVLPTIGGMVSEDSRETCLGTAAR